MKPAYRLTVDGLDVTSRVAPHLLSLSLTDKQGNEADELEIELANFQGQIKPPRVGGLVTVSIGWEGKALTYKGAYTIDELALSGPPDVIRLSAKSADFQSKIKEPRDKSYSGQTIGEIARAIAARNDISAMVHQDLNDVQIDHIDQTNESDIAFLTRCLKDYDGMVQIKDRRLVVMPVASDTTISGGGMPRVMVDKSECTGYRFSEEKREGSFTAVSAGWQDHDGGTRRTVTVGEPMEGSATRTIKQLYPTEEQARAAAAAELARIRRGKCELSLDLAYGNPAAIANGRLTVGGFPAQMSAVDWVIETVTHTVNSSGYVASISAKSA